MRKASPEEHFRYYRNLWNGENGLPLDRKAATAFLALAGTKEHSEAQFEMGSMVLERKIHLGIGPRNLSKSIAWAYIARASKSGHSLAHKMLGLDCLEKSQRTKSNLFPLLAYEHLRRAYEGGHKELKLQLSEAYKNLTDIDRADLEKDFVNEMYFWECREN